MPPGATAITIKLYGHPPSRMRPLALRLAARAAARQACGDAGPRPAWLGKCSNSDVLPARARSHGKVKVTSHVPISSQSQGVGGMKWKRKDMPGVGGTEEKGPGKRRAAEAALAGEAGGRRKHEAAATEGQAVWRGTNHHHCPVGLRRHRCLALRQRRVKRYGQGPGQGRLRQSARRSAVGRGGGGLGEPSGATSVWWARPGEGGKPGGPGAGGVEGRQII